MTFSRKVFPIADTLTFKKKAWRWAEGFNYMAILENNGIPYFHKPFANILAVGARLIFTPTGSDPFEDLEKFLIKNESFTLGYFSYDLKNKIETLESANPDNKGFDDILFFVPQHLIFFYEDRVELVTDEEPEVIVKAIGAFGTESTHLKTELRNGVSVGKAEYIHNVTKIKDRILNGDIYELNYCIEFSFEVTSLSPFQIFTDLIQKSPMPFSAFIKAGDHHIISASPERFLKKEGDKLTSQPIKGTIRRGEDTAEDEQLKDRLLNSEKERAENLMIVDLVRNDLAKSSVPGSVEVEELFGIYSFKQVHQMISTVSSAKRREVTALESIKNAFPMGSMTGAPKIKAMELIEKYESTKRGAYSGAAGYFTPSMDFDFNVLIRSIFYNAATKRVSFQVGSAITYDSDPLYEYNECLLKASAIFEVLGLTMLEEPHPGK